MAFQCHDLIIIEYWMRNIKLLNWINLLHFRSLNCYAIKHLFFIPSQKLTLYESCPLLQVAITTSHLRSNPEFLAIFSSSLEAFSRPASLFSIQLKLGKKQSAENFLKLHWYQRSIKIVGWDVGCTIPMRRIKCTTYIWVHGQRKFKLWIFL